MRVHLAPIVPRDHVDPRLVEEPHDLDVVRRLRELHARERARGDEPRAVPGLRAPRDHRALDVADVVAGLGGGPEAEVCKGGVGWDLD
jgi:hypothetical protein